MTDRELDEAHDRELAKDYPLLFTGGPTLEELGQRTRDEKEAAYQFLITTGYYGPHQSIEELVGR